jgi:hypothetical protein
MWPSNNIYSLGACIIQTGGYDSLWSYNHFYAARTAHAGVGLNHSPTIMSGHFESGGNIISDNKYIATLVQPDTTAHDMGAFSSLVLKSPSSSIPVWVTNYYQLTTTNHPYSVSWGTWAHTDVGNYDFFLNRANTNLFIISAEAGGIYTPAGVVAASVNSSLGSWGLASDGGATFQAGATTFYPDGSINFLGIHFESGAQTNSGPIKATSFTGSGANLTSLNADNISSGIVTLARGGTGASLSAAASNSVLTNNNAGVSGWFPLASLPGGGITLADVIAQFGNQNTNNGSFSNLVVVGRATFSDLSITNAYVRNFWMSTNENTGTTIDFSGPGRESRIISADLTITAFSNASATNYNDKIVDYKATGANRTLSWPASWIAPNGARSVVITNNQMLRVTWGAQLLFATNVTYLQAW